MEFRHTYAMELRHTYTLECHAKGEAFWPDFEGAYLNPSGDFCVLWHLGLPQFVKFRV